MIGRRRVTFGRGVRARQLEDERERGFPPAVEIERELRSRGVFEERDAEVPDVFGVF